MKRKEIEGEGGGVLYYKNGDSVEVRVSFIPVFFPMTNRCLAVLSP